MDFSADTLQVWTRGRWTQKPAGPITRIIHDTREMKKDALYVAIPGERFDGHDFIPSAMELGACAVLCSVGRGLEGVPCLEVEDPEKALLDLAQGHRQQLRDLIVAITGSAGKTTVKDLLAAMLSQRGRTAATRGNWNNNIGMPLSLLQMEPGDDFGVFEVGMNRPGEIRALVNVLQPLVGLVTSIGLGHAGAFRALEEIAEEKSSLLYDLPPHGVAIIDVDSRWEDFLRDATDARIVGISLHKEEAEYFGQPGPDGKTLQVKDRAHNETFVLPLPSPGTHMMRNVLQATAAAREFGLTAEEVADALENFEGPAMRWEEVPVGNRLIINDAYNANPVSMRVAIKTFAGLGNPQEKWLVLGGMRELGRFSEHSHSEVGRGLSKYTWAGLVVVGQEAHLIADAAEEMGAAIGQVHRVNSIAEAVAVVKAHAGDRAGILLKASRADRLEGVLAGLQKEAE